MHPEAMQAMTTMLARIANRPDQHVLDVGSLDVNGSYRELIAARGWRYTGLDTRPGRNVDVVAPDPYRYPFDDGVFDVVISGSTMEHVQAIWLWVPELVRLLRPGGYLAIVTHTAMHEHRYPVDCWRVLNDGMTFLFDQTRQLIRYQIWYPCATDIAGSAYKVPR